MAQDEQAAAAFGSGRHAPVPRRAERRQDAAGGHFDDHLAGFVAVVVGGQRGKWVPVRSRHHAQRAGSVVNVVEVKKVVHDLRAREQWRPQAGNDALMKVPVGWAGRER